MVRESQGSLLLFRSINCINKTIQGSVRESQGNVLWKSQEKSGNLVRTLSVGTLSQLVHVNYFVSMSAKFAGPTLCTTKRYTKKDL